MNAQQILDALLNSGKELVEKGVTLAEAQLDLPDDPQKRDAMMTGAGKGALAAGALALLFGTSTGRKLTGTTLKLGSLAAVGGVAYTAFQNWQRKQGKPTDSASQLADVSDDKHSKIILKAMIAAAKADGHIDEGEKDAISQHAESLGVDSSIFTFIRNELAVGLDINDIVEDVDSDELAAEVYLVSRMVLNVDNNDERQYLEQLAQALGLADSLVDELEQQVNTQE